MTGEPATCCPSCTDWHVCTHEWPEGVERPENVAAGLLCDECHESLNHYAVIARMPSVAGDAAAGINMLIAFQSKL